MAEGEGEEPFEDSLPLVELLGADPLGVEPPPAEFLVADSLWADLLELDPGTEPPVDAALPLVDALSAEGVVDDARLTEP